MAEKFSLEDRTGLINTLSNLFGDADGLDAFLLEKLSKAVNYPSPIRDVRYRSHFVLQLVEGEGLHAAFLQAILDVLPNDKVAGRVYRRLFPGSGAERNITHLAYKNPAIFRKRTREIENRLCRIEIDKGNGRTAEGTGFLVGENLVLTNFHVLKAVFQGQVTMDKVHFSFDYKLLEDGNPGPVVSVQAAATDPVPVSSIGPDMVEDYADHGMDHGWGDAQLDFALVRLEIAMGRTVPGTSRIAEAHEPERGWVSIAEGDVEAKPGNLVIIAQHPNGDYQKLSEGHFLEPRTFNQGRTRFRYSSNTEPGSSGSPCFNEFWELVGIHHFGDPVNDIPKYNQGIPIGRIREKMMAQISPTKYIEKVVTPKPAADVAPNPGDLKIDEFLRTVRPILGALAEIDTTRAADSVLTSVLETALKKGKFQLVRMAVANSLPAATALLDFIEAFARASDDPCETVVLPPNAMFLNHQPLRDLLRNLDSPFGNRTVVVREKKQAQPGTFLVVQDKVRHGHSHIRRYFNYLRNHTSIMGEVYEIDLRDLPGAASGKVGAADIARMIDDIIDLTDKRWKSGTNGEPEFKQAAFLNSFRNHFDRQKETDFLVIDSFEHLKHAFDDTVDGFVWGLVEMIGNVVPSVRLFLLDYGDRSLPGDIESIVETYYLKPIDKAEIVDSLEELVRISGERFALPDRDKISVAEKYAELVDHQQKDAFWGGELDPKKVRSVVSSIFSPNP